jgi:restriction system protein
MSIAYKYFVNPQDIGDNPHSTTCIYCKQRLMTVSIEKDIWEINDNELLTIHECTKQDYKEIHGLEDCYLNLVLDTQDSEVWINYCNVCGWWRLVKDVCICAEEWQIWDIFLGALEH